MGISAIKYPLNENLKAVDEELRKRFNISLKVIDRLSQRDKPSVLFEYFTLYNSVLALEPDNIEIILRGRGGPSFLISGQDPNKTVSKYGELIEPSIVCKKNGEKFNFWFDRPFIFFEKRLGTLRPDIVVRKGNFEFKDLSYLKYLKEGKTQLLKEGVLFAEFGIVSPTFHKEEKEYQIKISKELFGHQLYFRFKEEFIHPSLIIDCKGFGAAIGNVDKYAEFAKNVVIFTPEKFPQLKKENIQIIRINNAKRISNLDARNKLKELYQNLHWI